MQMGGVSMSVIYVVNQEAFVCVKNSGEFTEKMGFPPIMFRDATDCACSRDCLCRIDPFATARSHNVKLDIGDKHDSWTYLFVLGKPYVEFPENIIKMHTRSRGAHSSNDDRSNSLNPNNSAWAAGANNTSNQLNPNHPEFKGTARVPGNPSN